MAMFKERLRHLRKQKGLDQSELAEALNVASTTVSIWERGVRMPEMDTLGKISQFFDVSLAYLLGEETGEKISKASASFPRRLKELREERGLSQQELAEKLGVTKNTIFVWEKGKRLPEDEWATFNELSFIFEVPYEYIAGETDNRETHQIDKRDERIAAEEAQREIQEHLNLLCRMYLALSCEMQQVVEATLQTAYRIEKAKSQQTSKQEDENNRDGCGNYFNNENDS